ncbi:hypothetical protein PCANC_18075 [Puccinia coronata f. sp. avenae]|uniref:Uncharacterized protein n=1 Tax=Puccinia coronata f. sp. avenae TaxID=200324 RepID=A0A2N5UJ31_9BASI|nr:hypothetical protein PCANC_18075 [Puccinia coronata f. sp. avenae]
MGAHLRNGKNISFEQQAAAAAAAAAREQQRRPSSREQQPSFPSIGEATASAAVPGERQLLQHPANSREQLSGAISYAETPVSANREPPVPGNYVSQSGPGNAPSEGRSASSPKLQGDQTRASVHSPFPSSQGSTPRAGDGYTLSPAALERLRRAREQPPPTDGFRGTGPVGSLRPGPTNVRPPSRSGTVGDQLQSHVVSSSIRSINSSPITSGQTGLLSHAQRSSHYASAHGTATDAHSQSQSQRISPAYDAISKPTHPPGNDRSPTATGPGDNDVEHPSGPVALIRERSREERFTYDAHCSGSSNHHPGRPGDYDWDRENVGDSGRMERERRISPLEPSPPTDITPAKRYVLSPPGAYGYRSHDLPFNPDCVYVPRHRHSHAPSYSQPAHDASPPPPPIVQPRPIRPSTGPQDGQNLVALHSMAPPIPPRPEELNYQPLQAEQQYHQEMDATSLRGTTATSNIHPSRNFPCQILRVSIRAIEDTAALPSIVATIRTTDHSRGTGRGAPTPSPA